MEKPLEFKYSFAFGDGKAMSFDVSLDPETLVMVHPAAPEHKPEWSALEFYQCPGCTLDPKTTPHCPAALALFRPVAVFRDYLSYHEAQVRIDSPERTYSRNAPLHVGLSSLAGLCMVTSGCPVLSKLRPMVRYHLPFATEDETLYRAVSMYLTAQYLIQAEGGKPDWSLSGLQKIYDEVMAVNRHFLQRLQNTPVKDASLNAIITLDCFAMNITFALGGQASNGLRSAFGVYLGKG